MQKKYLMLAVGAFVLAVSLIGTGYVYAQSDTWTGKPIVQRIAERFNLNQADVQAVFDEQRDEMQQFHQQGRDERLDALVSEGKLTEDQKNALVAKLNERQNNWDNYKDLTPEERRTKMEQDRTDFENWLKQNNIDESVIGFGYGMGRGGFYGGEDGDGFRHGGPMGGHTGY